MIVRSDQIGSSTLRVTLAHELFHVLQISHLHSLDGINNWFTEASATWAGWHYGDRSDQGGYATAWYGAFQGAPALAPDCMECGQAYADWIYAFFMAQEGASMNRVWSALASTSGSQAATQAIDSVFPFKDHLRDFALRDLNVPYHEQGSSTAGRRFQSGAAEVFPQLPQTQPAIRIAPGVTLDAGVSGKQQSIPLPGALEARYMTVSIPNGVRHVKLDLSSLPANVDADALVQVGDSGTLEHRRLDSRTLDFCRDNAGDDISSVMLVLSNHALQGKPSGGNFSYDTDPRCGTAGLTGHLDISETLTLPPIIPGGSAADCDFESGTFHAAGHADIDISVTKDGTMQNNSTSTLSATDDFNLSNGTCQDPSSLINHASWSGGDSGSNIAQLLIDGASNDANADVTIASGTGHGTCTQTGDVPSSSSYSGQIRAEGGYDFGPVPSGTSRTVSINVTAWNGDTTYWPENFEAPPGLEDVSCGGFEWYPQYSGASGSYQVTGTLTYTAP